MAAKLMKKQWPLVLEDGKAADGWEIDRQVAGKFSGDWPGREEKKL